MKTTKNSIISHIVALAAVVLGSVIFMMNYLEYQRAEFFPMAFITALSTISVGYFRPFMSRWLRWTVLVLVVSICLGVCGGEAWLSWCAVLMCILSLAIVVRRMIMEKLGDNQIAKRSAMRELYNSLDGTYTEVATKLDNQTHGTNAIGMVPVAHAVAIMIFSLLCLVSTIESSHIKMDETGYYIYLGLTLAIPVVYALWRSHGIKDFLFCLFSAIVMTIVGVVVVVVCVFVAIIAIIFISAVFSAISNLLHKLFGKD